MQRLVALYGLHNVLVSELGLCSDKDHKLSYADTVAAVLLENGLAYLNTVCYGKSSEADLSVFRTLCS